MRTLTTITALALLPTLAAAQLNNMGFETGAPVVGGPAFPVGQWAFDNSAFVPTTSGIVPLGGVRMLQFINTSPGGPSGLVSSDVVQIVDLTAPAYQSIISTGAGVANGRIRVNRVKQNAAGTVDTSFGLILYAFSNLANAQSLTSPTATLSNGILSDNNPNSWQPINTSLALPIGTQYLGFRLGALENNLNNASGIEFDGHFADNARLRIVPAPGTAALAGLGGLLAFRRRR